MATKRMFAMKICDSDAFLDMPPSAQCLYFHLNMRADDDGFLGNPKRIQSLIGAREDDLKILIAKRFIIAFEDGVIVIKHWKMHNCIQGDRYTPTSYQDEKNMLITKANKAYSISGNEMLTNCIQNVSTGLGLGLDLDSDKGTDIKKSKQKEVVTYVPDDLLNQSIIKFIEMRKKIKAPMTEYAVELLIKKLDKMTDDNDIKIEILNQSIESSWKGIFPLKENNTSTTAEYAKKLKEWANE